MLNEKEKKVLDNYKYALLSGTMTSEELHNLVVSSEAVATLTDVRKKKQLPEYWRVHPVYRDAVRKENNNGYKDHW